MVAIRWMLPAAAGWWPFDAALIALIVGEHRVEAKNFLKMLRERGIFGPAVLNQNLFNIQECR